VWVTDHRRRGDQTAFVKELSGRRYKGASTVILVMGQPSTHAPTSLYEAFAPEETSGPTEH
jgi:hypothetical protein